MEFGQQRGGLVGAREQHPLIKPIAFGNLQEVRGLGLVFQVWPRHGALRVARKTRQLYVWRAGHPDGHATAAQAPRYGKAVEVAADDQCANRFSHGRSCASLMAACASLCFTGGQNYPSSATRGSRTITRSLVAFPAMRRRNALA